jgi:hypothetical protein
MALINADGIVFGNSTSLASKYGIIPQNTRELFYQASAPTGWTQVTTDSTGLISINNRALRVVDGLTGGTALGSNSFTSTFPSTNVVVASTTNVSLAATIGDTTLTQNQIPSHAHGAGSAFNNFTASAGTSPFRTPLRVPISYAFRSAYQQPVNFRVVINSQQPRTVQQPNSTRVAVDVGVPVNSQQPRTFRRPYSFRNRYPFQQPNNFQQPRNFQQPNNFSQPRNFQQPRSLQQPRSYTFRTINREGVRRGSQQPLRFGRFQFRQTVRIVDRVQRRDPVTNNVGVPLSERRPYSFGVPYAFRRPYGFRASTPFRVSVRSRNPANSQQPNSYRRPYAFQQPRTYRVVQNFRTPVNQRVPVTAQQPNSYRLTVRYPLVTNVRYVQRVLSPGGEIRGTDTNGPQSGLAGGGLAHNHPYTANSVPISGTLDLRVQYIDVIVCQFN